MTALVHYSSGVGDSEESINPAHFLAEPERILSSVTADVYYKTFWKWKNHHRNLQNKNDVSCTKFSFYIEQYRWV